MTDDDTQSPRSTGGSGPKDAREQERWRLWVSRALFLLAALCLGTYAAVTLEARWTDHVELRHLEAARGRAQAAAGSRAGGDGGFTFPAPEHGELLGHLEIPRLELSAVVLEGTEAQLLRKSAGRVPGTALPGEAGNLAIAGHRDRHFRPLSGVKIGDEISLATAYGDFRYRVESTRVVTPTDLEVLDDQGGETLTLLTCYPFSYLGPAPKRFVVLARRIG